jgi:signal transduction histidine kinase
MGTRIRRPTERVKVRRRREAILALVVAAFVILALLAVFAIELADTQAKSKRDVTERVHERAVLATALIDSLFQSVQQQVPSEARKYGARTVTAKTMNSAQGQNAYVALLDSAGNVIAHSAGFSAQARDDLKRSAALALTRAGKPYGLGNLLPYGNRGVINFATVLPTANGTRTLLTGFTPASLSTFLAADLRKIPGVKGAHNYLIDGNDTVLASTNPARPVGYVFRQPAQVQALSHLAGDRLGHYYDQVHLTNSTWRIVLAAPDGPLFASVSGLRKWVPWAIFAAFALFALAALILGRRSLRSAEQVRVANDQLEIANRDLAASNETLERRADELARSNAELEQFASIASHDLQEPLRKVRTFTQQLTVIEADRLSERGNDYLKRANSAAERMQTLIEDLLKFSRVATRGRSFAPVDLGQVTTEVLDDLSAEVERSGAIVHVGELPTIDADALQLRQLMQNLISNALKFRREDVIPEVRIDATVADDNVELRVHDNGIGFESQYGLRIFRVFERLHGRTEYPGTGIGLALCRKIAERHGGGIVADGEPGVGSTFTVTLPVHPRQEFAIAAARIGNGATPERAQAHVSA